MYYIKWTGHGWKMVRVSNLCDTSRDILGRGLFVVSILHFLIKSVMLHVFILKTHVIKKAMRTLSEAAVA